MSEDQVDELSSLLLDFRSAGLKRLAVSISNMATVLSHHVSAGAAKDYSEYKSYCGEISGYMKSIREIYEYDLVLYPRGKEGEEDDSMTEIELK